MQDLQSSEDADDFENTNQTHSVERERPGHLDLIFRGYPVNNHENDRSHHNQHVKPIPPAVDEIIPPGYARAFSGAGATCLKVQPDAKGTVQR